MDSSVGIESEQRLQVLKAAAEPDGERAAAELEAIFAAGHVGLAFLNRELRIARINPTLSALHGNAPMAELGLHVREVIPETAPIVEPRLLRVMDHVEPIHGQDLANVTPRVSLARVSFVPIYVTGHRADGAAVIFEDRTEMESARVAGVSAARIDALIAGVSEQLDAAPERVVTAMEEALGTVCTSRGFIAASFVRLEQGGARVETLSEWRDAGVRAIGESSVIGAWLRANWRALARGHVLHGADGELSGTVRRPGAVAPATVAVPVLAPGLRGVFVFRAARPAESLADVSSGPDIGRLRTLAAFAAAAAVRHSAPVMAGGSAHPTQTTAASGRRDESPLIGTSPAMRRVLDAVEAVSSTRANVLISGESGVGKERVARLVHEWSDRASKPFVKVNCASIPAELFESEFFGHVRGAFTGAHRDRMGRFALADQGTLFLDEVAEIPISLQAKLLRVLQEGEFERVGDPVTRTVDVRVIAATNRDLEEEMTAGRFREDLFYRLSVFPIGVPPLRQRPEDLIPLANHFLTRHAEALRRGPLCLEPEHRKQLFEYDWPGNVRELANVIERAVILSPEAPLRLELALPAMARQPAPSEPDAGEATERLMTAAELREHERRNLVATLKATGWRVAGRGGAAERLGMRPSTLRDRLRTLGIRRS